MSFQNLVAAARQIFPKLQIKYKDESLGMKILGKIMFFNPAFMSSTTTTIGDTVYFPSKQFIDQNEIASCIILLHELVHMFDQKKVSKFLFSISYLFPQIFLPLSTLLFFVLSWYIALPITLLFLAPIPAVFRMHWEKRAYMSSLYTITLLSKRINFKPHLEITVQEFISNFKGPSYYFMWPFQDIAKQFAEAVTKVESGQRPYEDPVFDMLDQLVTKA